MEKQSSEKRFALLIDADNVSAKYIKPITDELSKYGTVTYKRIYGDWTLTLHSKWKDALLENSITPIQQFGYTQGKNATDSAMIIDAMDILYAHSVEGFCIVSSDSDFTRLASRIRESGLTVIGMGEKKTPTAFRKACDIFTTLELLLGDSKNGRTKNRGDQGSASSVQGTGPTIEEIEQAVVNIITDNQNNGKSTGLGEVGSRLLKRYPDFDVRSYGTNLLSKLLDEFASVQITKDGSSVTVVLTSDAERDRKNGRNKDASRGRNEGAKRENGVGKTASPDAEVDSDTDALSGDQVVSSEDVSSASVEQVVEDGASVAEESEAADSKSTESKPSRKKPARKSKAAEDASEETPAKKPRRSTRMSAKRAEQADAGQGENIAAEPAAEMPDSVVAQPASTADAAAEPSLGEQAAEGEAVSEPVSQPADNRPGRSGRAKAATARNTESRRKKASQQEAKASQQEAKEPQQEAKEPQQIEPAQQEAESAEQTESAQPQLSDAAESAHAKKAKSANSRSRSARKTPAPKAEASHEAQGAEVVDPQDFIRQTLAGYEPNGIALATLGKRVRTKYRTFKLRDLGYSQFRPYLADLEGVELEQRDGQFYAHLSK